MICDSKTKLYSGCDLERGFGEGGEIERIVKLLMYCAPPPFLKRYPVIVVSIEQIALFVLSDKEDLEKLFLSSCFLTKFKTICGVTLFSAIADLHHFLSHVLPRISLFSFSFTS